MKMKYLVTGATGFIGQHVVRKLLEEEKLVRILVRQGSDISILGGERSEIAYGDLCDINSLNQALEGIDVVYHSAAFVGDWGPRKLFIESNFEGTENMLKASIRNRIKRFTHISTIDVFGVNTKETISEEFRMIENASDPYVQSKVLAENVVWEYYKRYDLPIAVIYPAWVYGPGDRHFFPEIIDALKEGKWVHFGNGNNHIELVYVENLADAIVMVSESKQSIGEGYIASDGINVTFRQLVEKIAEIADLRKPKIVIPYPLAYMVAFSAEIIHKSFLIKRRPLLTRYVIEFLGQGIHFDSSKIRQIGFKPRTCFEEGMKNAVNSVIRRKEGGEVL